MLFKVATTGAFGHGGAFCENNDLQSLTISAKKLYYTCSTEFQIRLLPHISALFMPFSVKHN